MKKCSKIKNKGVPKEKRILILIDKDKEKRKYPILLGQVKLKR